MIAYCFCADYWLRVKFPCLDLFTHRSTRLAHGSCLFTGSKGWRNTVLPDFQTNYLATNPLLISVSSFQNHTHPPPPSRDYSWGTASRCLQLSVSFHMVLFGRKLEILLFDFFHTLPKSQFFCSNISYPTTCLERVSSVTWN